MKELEKKDKKAEDEEDGEAEEEVIISKKDKKEKKSKKKGKKRPLEEATSENADADAEEDAEDDSETKSDKKKKKDKKSKKDKKEKKNKKAKTEGASGNTAKSGATVPAADISQSEVDAFRKEKRITVDGDMEVFPYTTFEIARKCFADVAMPPLNACCKGFKTPSPIQAQAWPIVLAGRDMVGIAQTGSGKTLAFLLPGLCRMLQGDYGPGGAAAPRALVLAPTRELAMQSAKVAEQACAACDELSALVVFGGQPKWEQRKKIQTLSTLDILVATPGRLLDFVNDQVIDLSRVHYLVLDEADRMLDMGFEKDVRRIIDMCAPRSDGRQTVMFSATWPTEIRNLASSFMENPIRVTVGSDKLAASTSVTQIVEVVEPFEKERKLLALLRKIHDGKNRIVVFGLYKKEAANLERALQRNGFKVMGVHGDKLQSAREEAVRKFDSGEFPILVATDVASRGLDIKGVEYVVNVTFPLTVEDYVHRIGRTGRAGAKGTAYTFFTQHDKHLAGALQNVLREAGEKVPASLAKFGNSVKKKEHKLYGSHFKETDGPMKEASHVTFGDDDSDDE
ncbi:ATP-dependent RNA helicase DBP3 [Hondaea fermentalgiana]|uniref:RNA helicase n=1 Tax=Hondaea fermentalgiana TaxID=2315210 RepID=A0A2R5H0Q9_9STRA|nr:ATP-dependent RNA helicase DBP3 [Hondaea fermentalgiana]|eukprot:GBG34361.1 ATP-dependent RNA helicase DBP3 [Hondaea fermentalgiana]